MYFRPFVECFPDLGYREMRSVTVFGGSEGDLPPGQYGFLEMYCNDPDCDCRRVMFYVVTPRSPKPLAVIAYGWEEPEFYRKWLKFGGPELVSELMGPVLNAGSPQSRLAPALLRFVQDTLLQDPAYIDRLKRHYAMFKQHIQGQGHRQGAGRPSREKSRRKPRRQHRAW